MTAHLTRTAKALVVALVTTFALAGCLKVDFQLVLQPDDTVDGSITYAIAEGTGAAASGEDETFTDEQLLTQLFGELDASEYANGVISDYNEDDWVGKTITFEGEELAGFALDESSEGITIVRDGDDFVVSGPYASGDDMTEGAEGAEMTLSITFPGTVSSTNGTLSEDEHTVTWDLLDAPESLEAVGGATEGGGFPWLIVIIVLVVVAVAGGAVGALLVLRRRGSDDSPAEPAGDVPPPPAPATEGNLDTLFPPAEEIAPEEPAVDVDGPAAEEAPSEDAVVEETTDEETTDEPTADDADDPEAAAADDEVTSADDASEESAEGAPGEDADTDAPEDEKKD